MKTISAVALTAVISSSSALLAAPSDRMPVAQQNELVQKYCAVCHTDTARNGGLSLQHFDAANIDPSLAAMLVSKLKNGALGAAGIPTPDTATRQALVSTLIAQAAGSHEWTVQQTNAPATKQRTVTASILRDLPSDRNAGEPSLYRLVLTCNAASREGEIQLSWSPTPATGTLHASVDGKAPLKFRVEGSEKMGNGQGTTAGPAAVTLHDTKQAAGKLPIPLQKLTISNLFPNETVVFPFDTLPQQAREPLSKCFTERLDR